MLKAEGEFHRSKSFGGKMSGKARSGSTGDAKDRVMASALSRIDSTALLDAVSIPRSGKVYDLGLELNDTIPHNPAFTPLALTFTHTPGETGTGSPFQFSADSFAGGLHIGTHMDALIHVQAENRIFGGGAVRDALTARGWKQFGMETIAPIIGRADCLVRVPAAPWTRAP